MKALITGASGFIGKYLSERLIGDGWQVSAVRRGDGFFDQEQISARLRVAAPDVVFHLAGRTGAANAAEFNEANVELAARLFDAANSLPRPPVIVVAGSAAEYGVVAQEDVPVDEAELCRPTADYGISKFAQTQLALGWARAGQRIVVARIWNAVGAGMPGHLALASMASQIAAMPSDGGILKVGNLDVARDFIDVREVARLLSALAVKSDALGAVLNIASGRAQSLRPLVERMIELSGRPTRIVIDPARLRPGELSVLYGRVDGLQRLGLTPQPPDFETLLPEILESAGGIVPKRN